MRRTRWLPRPVHLSSTPRHPYQTAVPPGAANEHSPPPPICSADTAAGMSSHQTHPLPRKSAPTDESHFPLRQPDTPNHPAAHDADTPSSVAPGSNRHAPTTHEIPSLDVPSLAFIPLRSAF